MYNLIKFMPFIYKKNDGKLKDSEILTFISNSGVHPGSLLHRIDTFMDLAEAYENGIAYSLKYKCFKALPAVIAIQTKNAITEISNNFVVSYTPIPAKDIVFYEPLLFLSRAFYKDVDGEYDRAPFNKMNTERFVNFFKGLMATKYRNVFGNISPMKYAV